MRIIKLDLMFLIVFTIIVNLCASDKNEMNYFEIQEVTEKRKGSNEPVTIKINFVDNRTKSIVNSIDLFEDNPFNHLPFNRTIIESDNYTYSRYGGIKLKDIFNDFNWMDENYYNRFKEISIYGETMSNYGVNGDNLTIWNTIMLYASDEIYLGDKTDILVYNNKGNVIFSLKNVLSGVSNVNVTENGKYLSYQQGRQMYAYPRMFREDPGVKIYNIETGELIFNKSFEIENEELHGISSKENIFFMRTTKHESNEKERLCYFINPVSRIMYYGTIDVSIWNRLKKITDDGLLLGKTSKIDEEKELFDFESKFNKREF